MEFTTPARAFVRCGKTFAAEAIKVKLSRESIKSPLCLETTPFQAYCQIGKHYCLNSVEFFLVNFWSFFVSIEFQFIMMTS